MHRPHFDRWSEEFEGSEEGWEEPAGEWQHSHHHGHGPWGHGPRHFGPRGGFRRGPWGFGPPEGFRFGRGPWGFRPWEGPRGPWGFKARKLRRWLHHGPPFAPWFLRHRFGPGFGRGPWGRGPGFARGPWKGGPGFRRHGGPDREERLDFAIERLTHLQEKLQHRLDRVT